MIRACAVATLLFATPLLAQDDADLARLLPAETPFYFETRNPTLQEMRQMATYKCLQDPRLRSLMERLFGDDSTFTTSKFDLGPARVSVNIDMSKPDFAVNVTYADAREKRTFRISQRFVVSWLGLTDNPLPIDLVAAVGVEGDPEAAIETLERIITAGVIAAGHAKKQPSVDEVRASIFSDFTHRDVGCKELDLDKVKLYLAPLGKLVVVATARPRLLDLVERYRDVERASLATDARFRGTLERADGGGTPMTVMYLQIGRTIDAVAKVKPQAASYARMFLGQVGLAGLESFTSVSRADGAGVTSTTAIRLSGQRRGLGRLFEPGPKPSLSCLEFAPKDSLYAGTGTLDLRAMYDIAVELGGVVVGMGEQKVRAMTGLSLRDDLLNTLGGEAGVIVSTNHGLLPDLGLVMKVKDGKRLEQSLLKLLALVEWPDGGGPVAFQVHGVKAYTVPLAHPDLLGFPLAPTFGIVDGHLLVTPYPISFQRFAGVKKGVRAGLAENRDFAKLRERVPDDALGISYLDVARLTEILYDTMIPLIQSMPPQPGANAHYELPDVELFSRNLYGRIGWRTADENGMYWHAHSSIDTTGAMLGAIGAAVGMFTYLGARRAPLEPQEAVAVRPVLRRDREATLCENNVRLIRARLYSYRMDHDALPDSLDALRTPHDREDSFLVPGHGKPYVYLGPKGRGGILLHGFPNGNDHRVCIITMKLRADRITDSELKRRLAAEPVRGPR